MESSLTERDWNLLLKRIADGKCTPIVGSEINQAHIPTNESIATSWAAQFGYPLPDNHDLARVAQYLSIEYDPFFPKEELQKQIEAAQAPNFEDPRQLHAILADLQLPIYITTNHDNFMIDALAQRKKDPQKELCRWNPDLLRSHPSILGTGYKPTAANPLVYYLHGHVEAPESMVLTEDDYLDFLVKISDPENILPPRIQQTLADSSLLFIGFRPWDWDFWVLFRGLIAPAKGSLRRISVAVQLPPLPPDTAVATQEKTQRYLSNYLGQNDQQIRVYWGSPESFLLELSRRWQGIESATQEAAPAQPTIDLMRLQLNLSDAFNLQELRELTQYELGIDFETFSDKKPYFILELVTYMQRRDRLYELCETCQRLRPHLQWTT